MTTAKEVYEWSVKEDRIPKEFLTEWLTEFDVGEVVVSWVDERQAEFLLQTEEEEPFLFDDYYFVGADR